MKKTSDSESGLAIVEAAILIPFCMLMVFALYYAALFMCQKANLQANLQNALIYYKNVGKNVGSDTYVEASDRMAYVQADGTVGAVGSSYGETTYLFPYRFFFGMGSDSSRFNKGAFASFFHSMCGNMFFDDGSNVVIEASEKNYVVYRTITATATQTVRPAISLEMVGMPGSLTLTVSGSAVISDGDDFIRNVDFVIDIVEDTALGKKAGELVGKAKGFYYKFKEKFKISEENLDIS